MTRPLGLTITPGAKRDIRAEWNFLETNGSVDVADRFVDAVLHTADLLCASPKMGAVFRARTDARRELRSLAVSSVFGKRLLVYSIGVRTLRIERLVHGAQDLARFFQ